MTAGELRYRFRFESRRTISDGAGNERAEFLAQFTVWTGYQPLRGGESVTAARLEARVPAILKIRNSLQARQIGSDWRAVNDRTGEIYAIREAPQETPDRAYLEMLVEGGVAA